MPQINGRSGPMVPETHKSDCMNSVLERAPEEAHGQTHRRTPSTSPCKKGGIMHSQENLQLEITTVKAHIRQAYKQYAKLKKTWASSAQRRKPYGKNFKLWKRFEITPV